MPAAAQKIACKAAGVCLRDGKLLLLKKRGLDWWILPGGRVEEKETPEAALAREMREELQCGVENNGLIGCFLDDYIEFPEQKIAVLAFETALVGEPRISNEIIEAKWFPAEEALNTPNVARGAKAALAELSK